MSEGKILTDTLLDLKPDFENLTFRTKIVGGNLILIVRLTSGDGTPSLYFNTETSIDAEFVRNNPGIVESTIMQMSERVKKP